METRISPTTEPSGTSGATTLSQAVDDSNAKFLGTGQPEKRKAGWPKGKPRGKGVVNDSATPPATGGMVDSPPLDLELVRKSVRGILSALDDLVGRKIYRFALHVSDKDKGFATSIVHEMEMTPDEKDIISNLSGVICQKYQLLGQYAPELLLGVCLAGYGTRTWLTLRKLRQLAEERAERMKAKSEPLARS